MLHTKELLNAHLAAFTAQPVAKVRRDTDRDFYMTPPEAVRYGLIDSVIAPHAAKSRSQRQKQRQSAVEAADATVHIPSLEQVLAAPKCAHFCFLFFNVSFMSLPVCVDLRT
jgi:hypothetical protein